MEAERKPGEKKVNSMGTEKRHEKKKLDVFWYKPKQESIFTKKGFKKFTKEFLENLLDSIEDFGECAFDRKAAFRHAYGYTSWTKSQYSKHLYDLKNRGYLTFDDKDNGQKSVKFTNKAKMKVLEKLGQRLEIDGKNRFVSYDMPEEIKDKRDDFRLALIQLGFKKIQKSLWVTNRDVSELIEMAAYTLGVEQYVVYIIAEKTDIDGIIAKKFQEGTRNTA